MTTDLLLTKEQILKKNRKGICFNTGRTHFKKGHIPWCKGKHLSEKIKNKISKTRKGISPWNKDKHPEYVQGKNHPMYGVHRFGNKAPHYNKFHSLETKQKISIKLKGYKHSEETKKRISIAKKGRKISLITRIKLSQSHKGNKSYSWKGGITPLNKAIKCSLEYTLWRESIFKRDNFICQICFRKGNILHSHHHIKSFASILQEFLQQYSQFSPIEDKETLVRLAITYEPFWNLTNGITLCIQCHKQIHFNKNATRFISI